MAASNTVVQSRDQGDYRAVVMVNSNGIAFPQNARAGDNLGGVSELPLTALADYTGNAIGTAANPLYTAAATASGTANVALIGNATVNGSVSLVGTSNVALVGNATVSGTVTATTPFYSTANTPTVTANVYAVNNVVGGKMTFTGLAPASGQSRVDSATVAIKSTQTASFDLYLFKGTTVTTFTDRANVATLNSADVANSLGTISFSTAKSSLGNATVYTATNVNLDVVDTGSGVTAVLVTTGTPTFATTSDVVVTLHTSA